jgi:hypothetical protein
MLWFRLLRLLANQCDLLGLLQLAVLLSTDWMHPVVVRYSGNSRTKIS